MTKPPQPQSAQPAAPSQAPRPAAVPTRVQAAPAKPQAAPPQAVGPQPLPLERAGPLPISPADPALAALGRAVPPGVVGQAEQISRLDPSVQRPLLLQLQRHQGNFHVQRVIQRLKTQQAAPPPQPDDNVLAQRIAAAQGSGESLPDSVAETLAEPLGADLGGVRVHADTEADALASAVDAVAFTTGQDIFFQHGAYAPSTESGLHLLAHELAHTVQQAQGPVDGTPVPGGVALSDPADRFEQAAETQANAALRHAAAPAKPRPVAGSGPVRPWQLQRRALAVQRVDPTDPAAGRSGAKAKAEVSFDVKDDSIKIEAKGEVPFKTLHWKWGQVDFLGSVAVSGEAHIPGVGKQNETTGQKNKASLNSLTNRVSEASLREGVKGTWDEADRLFSGAPTEIEADFEANAKSDTEGGKTKGELAGQLNYKLKWPGGFIVQGKAVVLKVGTDPGKEGTAGLPFKLEGPAFEVEPKFEFSKKITLPDVPEVKLATLKFVPGLKGVAKPDYKYVGLAVLEKIAPKLMATLGMGSVGGALQWLANNPFVWGGYITIKAALATMEEWWEMLAVARNANGATDAYTKGFLSAFGGTALGYTHGDTENGPAWTADGAAAGQLAFDAQIALVQAHPAFMHLGFSNEELAAGLRELGPKNAQNIYDVIYPDAAAKIKQAYYNEWEKNVGTTRQVIGFLQGLVDDDASSGRRKGEQEAMKALMGLGKTEAAPLLKEKDKAAVIPVKRVRAWRYTLANFETGLAVPNVDEYFQVLNGVRKDLNAHKAHLETLKPAMEQAGLPLQDFTVTFWVVGYASRLGGQGSNQALAEKRAASVSGLLQGSLGGEYKYNASGKGAAVPKESNATTDMDDPRPEADPTKLDEFKKQKLEEYRQQFPNISEAERRQMVEDRYGAASNEETMRRVDIFMNWEGYEMP